ncbi:putative oxalocrotonate tautomerase [Mycena maculata]|uniref:Oxalocrotonate tautomerase n=1 Tax=Mycena maculata TaxID=230809 RepID=A0AAD7JGC1_9AGAR|nr:putative oxalocrotonate tautomerase [Mycena maculata]
MPLHRIFTPKGLYSPEEKAAMAAAITNVYAALPLFYVVVLFIDLEPGNFFVGGRDTQRFVRISVEHLARSFGDDDSRKRAFLEHRYEPALEPFTKGRGIDWEVQITDCDVSTLSAYTLNFTPR